MQAGFWIIVSAFTNWFDTPETEKETEAQKAQEKQKSRLSRAIRSLEDEEERILISNISGKIFTAYSNGNNPSDSHPFVAFIFRQSKSWKHLDRMFYTVDTEYYAINLWRDRWLKQISSLRGHQKTILETRRLLYRLKEKGDNPKLKSTLNKTITDAIGHLTEEVKEASNQLEKDMQNKALNADPHCKRVIDFISTNWPYLTVFATWPEVQMDTERLAVHSRPLKESESDAEQLIDPLSDDLSIKAVFITEKIDNELRVKNYEIAPEQTSDNKGKASPVLPAEFVFDEENDFGKKNNETKKRRFLAKPSKEDRIHYLFNIALDYVSLKLATNDDTAD